MTNTQAENKHLAVNTLQLLTKAHQVLNKERLSVLFALCELTGQDLKKAMGILTSDFSIVTNVQTATNWEEIRKSTLSFADQIANTFPMPDEEVLLAEKRVKELTELKAEDAEAYFTDIKEYGYYLFPELEIAFCLDAEYVKMLSLPYPDVYQLS